MNRFFATLAVLGMMLLAVSMCLKQTVESRHDLGDSATTLIIVETFAAVGLIVLAASVIRRRALLPGKVKAKSRVGVVHPLRRLLSAVWS